MDFDSPSFKSNFFPFRSDLSDPPGIPSSTSIFFPFRSISSDGMDFYSLLEFPLITSVISTMFVFFGLMQLRPEAFM